MYPTFTRQVSVSGSGSLVFDASVIRNILQSMRSGGDSRFGKGVGDERTRGLQASR